MSNSDLDSLLDTTLDDLEDLPSFKPFPAGAHQCTATFEQKDIGGRAAIELNFTLKETLELADPNLPESERSKPGDTANTMFLLENEYGRGNLKKCAAPFAEALNLSSLRDVVEQVRDVECVIISSIRVDKNDPDKKYLNVKEIQIV
jgi:hypothetical protein